MGGGGIDWQFGFNIYTRLYLKWMTNKALLCSTWNSAQCYVAAWMALGVWGRKDKCIYMAGSLRGLLETVTTFFVNQLYLHKKEKVIFGKTNTIM